MNYQSLRILNIVIKQMTHLKVHMTQPIVPNKANQNARKRHP